MGDLKQDTRRSELSTPLTPNQGLSWKSSSGVGIKVVLKRMTISTILSVSVIVTSDGIGDYRGGAFSKE